jgi:predicted transcriptional regulator
MGIADMFGLGKKTKIPFRIPGDVSALRSRIAEENRENYPNFAKYQDIFNDVRVTCKKLDDIIARTEYGEEAFRVKEDLKKRMDHLTEKVNKNRNEAMQEDGKDLVVDNLEYLERKGRRDQAKTLFTECLEAFESIMTYYKEERLKHGSSIEAVTGDLIKAIESMNKNFFKIYGEDREIKELISKLLEKIQDLNEFFEANELSIKEKGLDIKARSGLKEINESRDKIL